MVIDNDDNSISDEWSSGLHPAQLCSHSRNIYVIWMFSFLVMRSEIYFAHHRSGPNIP